MLTSPQPLFGTDFTHSRSGCAAGTLDCLPPKKQMRQPSLLAQLVSGKGSLIQFDMNQVESLRTVMSSPFLERQIRKELKLILHTGLARLRGLRDGCLPVVDSQASFEYPIERDYALQETSGDKLFGRLDSADLHALSAHIKARFLQDFEAAGAGGLTEHHQNIVYLTAFELLA